MNSLVKWSCVACLAAVIGCSGNGDRPQPESKGAGLDKGKLLLAKEPAGAKGVIDTRKSAKDGEDVVVVARVGGNKGKPFSKGRLSFTIIDMVHEPCDDDGCGNPWCSLEKEEEIAATAFVKFEEDGRTMAHDAEKELGLKMCQVVVITGKARRDSEGNLTIVASGLHAKP
jgi:hypothetical protein